MELMEQLRQSDCSLCHTARDEIIRLEAQIINRNKMAQRLRPSGRASAWLRSKVKAKAPKSAAGRALAQPIQGHHG